MRFIIQVHGHDLIDVEVHFWRSHGPAASPGPALEAMAGLECSERADYFEPDTTTFGFSRRTW